MGVLALVMVFGVACTTQSEEATDQSQKLQVVTTLFPQYDFTKAIGKDKVEVRLLLPPGIEAHAYEPTPQDVVSIQKADLFIYTGENMEPWALKILESVKSDKLIVVDGSQGITLLDTHESEEAESDDHEEGAFDPHFWTNPLNAIIMVDTILEALIQADPSNAAFYTENARLYKEELKALDRQLEEGLSELKSRTIINGGHFAFGYFAQRYDLDHVSPYEGFSPDAEPTPQKIAEMIDLMNSMQIKTVFYQELIDPRVAGIIAEETGATLSLLHGAHNVSKDELKSGVTYITIMKGNLERLKAGLNGE